MVLALVAALVIAVRGGGSARLRGLVLLLVPLALLGPWLTTLAGDRRLLLSGPGLGVRGGIVPAPWQLALLHPDGPARGRCCWPRRWCSPAWPGCSRRDRASAAMTALAVTGLLGLALGLLAPHLVLASPAGPAGAGPPSPRGPAPVWTSGR